MAQFVGDVFGLNTVYEKQLENIANGNFASWPEGSLYGYFGGGNAGGARQNTILKLDFFSDTVSDPANTLPTQREFLAATSSTLYGYFGGGRGPITIINTITRLDFSNETVSLPGKNLPGSRVGIKAVSSSSYGYFGGGSDGSAASSLIFRLDFINETISNPVNLLSAQTEQAVLSDNFYGYFAGGTSNAGEGNAGVTRNSNIWRLDFSLETVSLLSANLSDAIRLSSGTSSASYGYFAGGEIFGSPFGAGMSSINRLDLSTTISSKISNLPSTLFSSSASSSNYYGYFGGGNTSVYNTPTTTSNILRLDFSNETLTNNPARQLTSSIERLAALSGGQSILRGKGFKTYGYYCGGDTDGFGAQSSSIFRLDFSNNTVSNTTNLPAGRSSIDATSSNLYGYIVGGTPPASNVSKFDFFNETISLKNIFPPGGSTILRAYAATESNSYGYLGGGSGPPILGPTLSSISRLDFFVDTTLTNPGNNLPIAKYSLAAISSSFYGYFAGGVSPSTCTISRIDFSNETVSEPGKNLLSTRYSSASVKSTLYGYFAGGYSSAPAPPVTSTVNRLDFSNETVSNPGKVVSNITELSGTESILYGYIIGGIDPTPGVPSPPATVSTITLLDFSNETITNSANNLPIQVTDGTALSNSN